MNQEEYMLTTIDNPYDPFTQFENWYAYDEHCGYATCGLLARLSMTSSDMSDEENLKAIDEATNEILKLFPGFYKKVYRE